MSSIEFKIPRVITVNYHQDANDTNYGCCMWARFYFDLDNYSISIESDCGSYGYSWVKTPSVEKFLHLCNRLDYYYLLEKLSCRSVFNHSAIWENLQFAIDALDINDELTTYHIESGEDDYNLLDALKHICFCTENSYEFVDDIRSEIKYTPLEEKLDTQTLWECIETDFPSSAKTICKIFVNEIMPWFSTQKEFEAEFKRIEG